MFSIDELKKPEFIIHDITFKVNKIPALMANDLLDYIRTAIGDVMNIDIDDLGTSIIEVIGKIKSDDYKYIRSEFFKYIEFKRVSDKTFIKMADYNQDQWSTDLEAADIYELFLRAFMVNFYASLAKMKTELLDQLSLIEPKTPV